MAGLAKASRVVVVGLMLALPCLEVSAQEVLAVRPQGAVVDVEQLEDIQPGAKVAFVREDGERQEIAQGWVLEVKDGKALVGLPSASGVKKGDLIVVCPKPGEDPYEELRSQLAELEEEVDSQPKGRRPGRIDVVRRDIAEALEARDSAVEDGTCDLAAHDAQIGALAQSLAKVMASRSPARREGARRTSRPRSPPAPAEPPEEEQDEDESTDSAPEDTASSRGASTESPTTAQEAAPPRDSTGLQTALDTMLKLIETLPSKGSRRNRDGSGEGSPETDEPESVERESVETESLARSAVPPSEAPADEEPVAESAPPRGGGSSAPNNGGPPSSTSPGRGPVTDPGPKVPTGRLPGRRDVLTGILKPRDGSTPARQPADDTASARAPEAPAPGESATGGRRQPGRMSDRIARLPGATKGPRTADTPRASEAPRMASITGRVVNDKGEPLAGARIAIAGATTTTTAQGTFQLQKLKPGSHRMTASAAGFRPETRSVSLAAGKAESVTVALRPAGDQRGKLPAIGKRPRKLGEDAEDE